MAWLTIKCPTCGETFRVGSEVVTRGAEHVMVKLDRSAGFLHLRECPGVVGKGVEVASVADRNAAQVQVSVSKGELRGRIDVMLDSRAYLSKGGSRACTMCGMNGADCLVVLEEKGDARACCAACHNGNTHPVPGQDLSCAEWGQVNGAKE